jgi:hypothetical protein
MRIDSVGIYTSQGQPGNKIATNEKNAPKTVPAEPKQKAVQFTKQSFPAMLSEAESAQLTKLFGKFDIEALTGQSDSDTKDVRPGRFIDIVV